MTIMMAKVVQTNESDVVESERETESSDDDAEDKPQSNAAWADSIAKILKTNKPKRKKTVVLSKAKKLTDVTKQKTKAAGFEVATADGEIEEGQIEVEDEKIQDQPPRKKKRELPNLRVKPNILEKDREKTLAKIATKGVVQLFNAVRMQQKDIGKKLEEAGPMEVRKEKVLKSIDKRKFLDVLMGEKSQVVEDSIEEPKREKSKEQTTWSVLRDDFMMGAKLKDWDRELEEEMETEENVEIESD